MRWIMRAIGSNPLLTAPACWSTPSWPTDPSTKVAMSIVTQAFGLTSKYVDTFANSYLYSGHSSTVHHVVEECRLPIAQR